ncbi:hypothetical protein JCM10450v2_003562 [Rhodotorula kratochvilovae]
MVPEILQMQMLGIQHGALLRDLDLRTLSSRWELAALIEHDFRTGELRERTTLESVPSALRHRILVFATLAFQPDGRTVLQPAPATSRPSLLHAFKQMVLGAANLVPFASANDAHAFAIAFATRAGRLLQGTLGVRWAPTYKKIIDLRIV